MIAPVLLEGDQVTEPGFYAMTAAQYHADPCPEPSLSSSIAHKLVDDTPLHARRCHPRLNPELVADEAEHFDTGTAAHLILLEGVNRVRIVDGVDDWRTNAAKDKRDDIRARGLIPLLAKTWTHVEAMTAATRAQLDAHVDGRRMFTGGQAELVAVWKEGGLWCRARLDYLRPDGIDDYKTTKASANPEQLSRSMLTNGWDMQAVFYKRGVEELTGQVLPFRFACQELYDPYALAVVALGPEAEMLAQKKLLMALERWGRGLRDGYWPGYGIQTAYVSLPPWVEAAWLDKEVRDAL